MKNKASQWTYFEVLERFEYIEKKLSLDTSLIQGVPWWDMLRNDIFDEISDKLCVKQNYKKKNYKKKNFFVQKLFNLILIIKNLFKIFSPKSAIWIKTNSNIILGQPRRKFEEGKYIDTITDPFIDLFPKAVNFSVIEKSYNNNHFSPAKTKNLFYADSLYNFAIIISKFKGLKFTHKDLSIISSFEEIIYNEFFFKIDIKKKIKDSIKIWLGIYPLMRLFFKYKKPKILFVVVSLYQEAIIAAAKSLGIITVELQHGATLRGNLVYDYTSGIEKKSFSDYFLSFGDYWSKSCKLPLRKDKIISFGNPYLFKKINSYSHIVKEDRMVIISQNLPIFVRFAIDIKKHFSNRLVVEYKPHPIEFYYKEPDYFNDLRNAGVVISNEYADLYEIFARSRWQVSVNSTALFEGLYFGNTCFVINTSESISVKNLINLDLARLISSPEDIDLNWKFNKENIKAIFSQPTKKNIDYIISLIK